MEDNSKKITEDNSKKIAWEKLSPDEKKLILIFRKLRKEGRV